MALLLPPAPIDAPFGSYNWVDWYEKVRRLINAVTIISWAQISDFTGSNLNQLVTRSHQSLQNVLGTVVPDTAFGHVPTGGVAADVLTKISGTDYDYGWAAGGAAGTTDVLMVQIFGG